VNNLQKISFKSFWLFLITVITISIVFSFASPPAIVNADQNPPRDIRVGVIRGFTDIENPNGATNFIESYFSEIAKLQNWNCSYKLVALEEGLAQVANGDIDLFGPVQYSPERAEIFEYPELEFGYEQSGLYALNSDNTIFFEDFNGFNGIKVGLVKGNYNNKAFEEYCSKNGFKVEEVYYDDVEELLSGLKLREVSAIAASSTNDADYLKLVASFASEKFYYVTKKGNTDIINELNLALNKLKMDNPYFDVQMFEEYYNNSIKGRIGFTRKEYDYIVKHPVFNLVGDPLWQPIEYFDIEKGMQSGINGDIIKEISSNSGIKFNFIQTKDYAQSSEMIKIGDAELISGNVNTLNDALIYTTSTYVSTPVALIGLKKINRNKTLKIAVPKSYNFSESDIQSQQYGAKVVYYDTIDECIEAVKKSEADSMLISIYLYDVYVKKGEVDKMQIIKISNLTLEIKLGVSKQLDITALSIMNKAISNLTEKQKNDAIIANTVNVNYPWTLQRALKQYYQYLLIVIFSFVIIIFIATGRQKTKLSKRLKKISYTDPLTGASSLEKFKNDSKEFMHKYGRENYSLLYLDIDKFKYINDTFGYNIGNNVLCYVAKCIENALYEYEIFARISGDTFIILLKNTDEKEIVDIIKKITRNIQLQKDMQKSLHKIFVCVGIYKLTKKDEDLFVAIDKANIARKTIKGKIDILYAFYDDTLHKKTMYDVEIVESMKSALEEKQFELYLQPKMDLASSKISGAEALVRWNHPKRGLLAPGEFIPVLEKNGLITEIDFFIFEETCRVLRGIIDRGEQVYPISVNLSRVHMSSNKFIGKLSQIAKSYDIPPSLLELELTETVVFQNISELLVLMNKMKSIGFNLSMDDFGSGYSSLNILKELPFDILKIDRGFFNAAQATPRDQTILNYIVEMAHKLDMRVVSEGVETQEQSDLLKAINCDYAQGFLFARPMPVENYLEFVKNNR